VPDGEDGIAHPPRSLGWVRFGGLHTTVSGQVDERVGGWYKHTLGWDGFLVMASL